MRSSPLGELFLRAVVNIHVHVSLSSPVCLDEGVLWFSCFDNYDNVCGRDPLP